jgi:hypothetical protein
MSQSFHLRILRKSPTRKCLTSAQRPITEPLTVTVYYYALMLRGDPNPYSCSNGHETTLEVLVDQGLPTYRILEPRSVPGDATLVPTTCSSWKQIVATNPAFFTQARDSAKKGPKPWQLPPNFPDDIQDDLAPIEFFCQ